MSTVKSDTPLYDLVIIGGGIIGSTISQYFTNKGIETVLIDSNEPMGGTAPSGGHLRPSWFKGMEKEDYIPAMDVLDECWGLKSEEFQIVSGEDYKLEEFKRVNVDTVLKAPRTLSKALQIKSKENIPLIRLKPLEAKLGPSKSKSKELGGSIRAKLLIVAAGIWTERLFFEVFKDNDKRYNLQGKQGVSFRYKGQLKSPFIEQWAPYKQVSAHNQNEEEIWIDDGTSVLPKKWKSQTTVDCLKRCREYLPQHSTRDSGRHTLDRQIMGIRPFIKSGPVPCLCERIYPNIWVVTGAAKLGTIAAGWAALKIYNEHRSKS